MNPGAAAKAAGAFRLAVTVGPCTVSQIQLANTGTALASDIQGVQLWEDLGTLGTFDASDVYVATGAYVASSGHFVFPMSGTGYAIGTGVTKNFLVTLNVANGAGPRTFVMQVSTVVPSDVSVATTPSCAVTLGTTVTGNAQTISGTPAGLAEGDSVANSTKPLVTILNPGDGTTVGGDIGTNRIRVQVQVFSPAGAAVSAVVLSTDAGATFPTTLAVNSNYSVGTNAWIYEGQITLNPGSYTLQARATNASGTTQSGTVLVAVNSQGRGDGNLLVRDNSAQLCLDCHGSIKSHSSQTTSTAYGQWGTNCRDCHQPHGTTNLTLVKTRVTPPAVNGFQTTKSVTFYSTTVGDSATSANVSYVTSDATKLAAGTYGICQTCHTRTKNSTAAARWRNTGNADTHYTAAAGTEACTNCHKHTDGFAGSGDCTGCHNTQQGIRRPIVPEFTNAAGWSHKRSGGFTVTKEDCIVCHMEGDPATGGTTADHKNGVVNLRDPDTGLNIKGVTFTAAGGASPGSYSPTTIDATFTQFSRNLTVTLEADPNAATLQAIMINQCLKCHDANGALSTSARVPTTGTAGKPFGTTIAGAGYLGSTGNTACATGTDGCVTNVAASFATSNSSYHPILGKQNNWYAKLTRMVAPWNAATRGGTVDVTSWGPLLSCWDCHALPADAGTITKTVTAHGGTATLRGSPTVPNTAVAPALTTNEATLCKVCHAGYTTSANTGHDAGSALSGNTNNGMGNYTKFACNICHGSGWTTAVVRPVRAQDVHGVNVLPTGGLTKTGRWLSGTPNAFPYAFIRDTAMLTNHTPARIGGTAYTATCTMSGNAGPQSCNQGAQSYTVGGTY